MAMKPIDDYKIGDTVIMWMTGMITRFVGKCVSTIEDPTEGTPAHDHPRFEIIGMQKLGESREDAPENYQGSILKPGDYIIMEDCEK